MSEAGWDCSRSARLFQDCKFFLLCGLELGVGSMPFEWESRVFHAPREGDGRNRDIFPLPFLKERFEIGHQVSRSVERRVKHRHAVNKRVNMAVHSLNSMFFGGGKSHLTSTVDHLSDLTSSQQDAMRNIIDRVQLMGPPPSDASSAGALSALRAAGSSYTEPEPGVGSVVDMDLSLLSLPNGKVAGVSLLDSIEGQTREMVADFENYMLEDADRWTSIESELLHVPPYNDKLLSSRRGYLDFIQHLFRCGVLGFTSTCKGRVGAFCVSKKPKMVDGKEVKRQRLVLDCRQTNLLFKSPPLTELGSLSALSRLSLEKGKEMWIAGADIKDCFYAVNCPTGMCDYFCLSSDLSYSEALSVTGGDLDSVFKSKRIIPCIKVLPMGFNWSFYLIQVLHEQSVLKSLNIPRSSIVLEGHPPPSLVDNEVISMPYCDNVHSIATSQKVCQDGCDQICENLESLGFELHEKEEASTYFKTLGGEIDGMRGIIKPTSARMWRISITFEYLARAKVSYKLVQRLLGHAMTVCVINRCGMPIFRKLYDFVEKQEGPRRLNASEREEALIFVGLIPMLVADMRRPWSDTLLATDASPDGYGICESHVAAGVSRSLGTWNERWRYKRLPPEQWAPRKRASGRDVFNDVVTVLGEGGSLEDEFIDNDDFPEVPKHLLDFSNWQTAKLGKWGFKDESITIKEGRALVLAVRRLARSQKNRGKNHVVFMDNLALCFSTAKGRGKNFSMLRIMQQIGSISLACNLGIFPRWIPSEDNPADGPSRGQVRPGTYSPTWSTADVSSGKVPKEREENCGEGGDSVFEAGEECNESSGEVETNKNFAIFQPEPKEVSDGKKVSAKCFESCRQQGGLKSHVKARDEECLSRSAGAVRGLFQSVQGLLSGERSGVANRRSGGRSHHVRLSRPSLRDQQIYSRGGEVGGSVGVFQSGAERHFDSLSKSNEGMEKGHALPEQVAPATDCNDGDLHGFVGQKFSEHVADDNHGIRLLSSPRRSPRPKGDKCCSSSPICRSSVQMGHPGDQGVRGAPSRQNWGVRQFNSHRQNRLAVAWSRVVASQEGVEQTDRSHVQLHHGGISKTVPKVSNSHRARRFAPLPIKTWRGYRGSLFSKERIQRGEKPRKMEDGFISPKVRQNRKSATVAQQDVSISDSLLQVGGQESGELLQRCGGSEECMISHIDIFTVSSRPHKFALEIFAGTARVSQAVSTPEHKMFPIDICLFPSHNVLCPRIEQKILTWVRSGRIWLIWLGMPCTTFSRARKNDGLGPGPLRSSDSIWGLPGLSPKDQSKVSEGNALFYFTLRVLQTCIQYKVPFVLENPLSSMAWVLPPLVNFIESAKCLFCDLDYCQFGESWKKPTRLMYKYLDISCLSKRCCGSYNRCSSTNLPHVRLSGMGPNNVFMTLLAQPYPWKMCRDFAQVARALRG